MGMMETLSVHLAMINVLHANKTENVLNVPLTELMLQIVNAKLIILKLPPKENLFALYVVLDVMNVLVITEIVKLALKIPREKKPQNVVVQMDIMTHVIKT